MLINRTVFQISILILLILFILISCKTEPTEETSNGYTNEDVTIETIDPEITLSGTLSMPHGKGSRPALLFLTGSGGHTRDQVISGLPMFEVIGNYLASKGYVVLRVDDRGVGNSTGPNVRESTTLDRANDALASLNFLRIHDAVDTSRIGLLGHSEGTFTGALLATELSEVDFMIMLSPWAIPGSELWVWQQGTILRDEGEFSEDKIQKIESELYKMVSHIGMSNSDEGFYKYGAGACLAWGDPPEDITDQFVADAFGDLRQSWYQYFFSTNPKNTFEKLQIPLLALFGSEDKQTPPNLNVNYLSNSLISAGNTDFTIKILPGDDHFFMTGEGLEPNEHVHGEMKISEKLLLTLSHWLSEQDR